MGADRFDRWWDRVWFAPEPAATMVFLRWVVLGVLAADTWTRRGMYRGIPDRPPELWDPISLLGWFQPPQPSAVVVDGLLIGVAVGVVLALAGVLSRFGSIVAAVSVLVLTLMANSFGKINHDQQMLVLMVIIVAVSAIPRRGDPDSWRFRWPVQACRLTLGLMLLTAGMAKVAVGGPEWVFSSTMRNILVPENLLFRNPPMGDLALWVASEPWRWQLAAAGAMVGELVLIVAVFIRRWWVRSTLGAVGAGTVVGITLLIGLVGYPIVALVAVFAEPGELVGRYRAGRPVGGPILLTAGALAVLAATAAAAAGFVAALPIAAACVAAVVAIRKGLVVRVDEQEPATVV